MAQAVSYHQLLADSVELPPGEVASVKQDALAGVNTRASGLVAAILWCQHLNGLRH